MAGKVLDLQSVIIPDQLGTTIAQHWVTWNTLRQPKMDAWDEVRRYVYATDTSVTSNSKLPWKNKTTIPKLCQIRDNLFANYMASMFPKRKWLAWEADNKESNNKDKRDAIVNYSAWMISPDQFKKEVQKLILDYIDYGNCFVMPDWRDNTVELEDRTQTGYVGPVPKRISPVDLVFNPIAPSFEDSPKIVRSIVQIGEVKELITRLSKAEEPDETQALWDYVKTLRHTARQHGGDIRVKDAYLEVDGFSGWRDYLTGDYVELLTFYGDIYDYQKDEYLRNRVIVVADRHKVIHNAPNPSFFGRAPIFHVGWRPRQDNLWAMGPLDNLVGMQYRIDHIENLKADVFDLTAFPPLKIKGYVEDFTWGPMEKIVVGDEGDVEIMSPDINALNANIEIQNLEKIMEEMAGAPKEALGFRTPGEKTKYEVQRLENAASRVFQNKISQFEEQLIEPLLNAMLELARRKMTSTSVRVFDDEYKFNTFQDLTVDDITGTGRIKPIAARHFAEKAQLIQDINGFFTSPLGQDPEVKMHWSSVKLSKMMEEVLEVEDYKIVMPFVRLDEQADAQRFANSHNEQINMESQTPHGLTPDDYDADMDPGLDPVQGDPNAQAPGPGVDQAPQGQ